MNFMIEILNQQINNTRDLIFETEKIIEREEFRKESGKSYIYII